MSYTEIYKFKKDGNASLFAEIKNAWRGAMSVWNILDKKHLPPYVPDWAIRLGQNEPGKEYYRMHDAGNENARKEVWGLYWKEEVPEAHRIVMGSTFDNVVVMKEDLPKLIQAFRDFDKEFEGQTSLSEQADVIEKALKEDDLIAVAWNQTSVNSDVWETPSREEDEDGNTLPYNLLKHDKHWSLFEDLMEQKKEEKV